MIRVEKNFYALRVYFDDVLHVHINARKLLAVDSWKDGQSYWVEFTLNGGKVLTEYDDQAKWLEVMQGLESVL